MPPAHLLNLQLSAVPMLRRFHRSPPTASTAELADANGLRATELSPGYPQAGTFRFEL